MFGVIRTIRRRGGTVLYVTHRLQEVFAIADRVSVLRDGRRVATEEVGDLDHDRLVQLIVGRSVEACTRVCRRCATMSHSRSRACAGGSVQEITLTLHRGEIVGVTGLVGPASSRRCT